MMHVPHMGLGIATAMAVLLAAAAPGCGPEQASAAHSGGVYRAAAASSSGPRADRPVGTAAEGPATIMMDRLDGGFGPARFAHKAHFDMARMGEGCALCHHHSPDEEPAPSCARCHTGPLDEKTAGSLGLKGALHFQCMGCHDDCGFDRDCTLCHGEKGAAQPARRSIPPRIGQPSRKVWSTPRDGGDKVAFDHANHARECGPCATCHRNESCTVCHGLESVRTIRPKASDPHAKCMDCHGKGKDMEFDCSDCHSR